MIADVGMALGEVTKLRRLNDFYREKIRDLEAGKRPQTASSFMRRRLDAASHGDAHHDSTETDRPACTGVSAQMLNAKIRALESENQMLKQQRDDFSDQVVELNGKLEDVTNATEERIEQRLLGMRPCSERSGFEEEFKELKRLRVLMRFSELKKDSDKLHETFKYVSRLEIENTGLRTQLDNVMQTQTVAADANSRRASPLMVQKQRRVGASALGGLSSVADIADGTRARCAFGSKAVRRREEEEGGRGTSFPSQSQSIPMRPATSSEEDYVSDRDDGSSSEGSFSAPTNPAHVHPTRQPSVTVRSQSSPRTGPHAQGSAHPMRQVSAGRSRQPFPPSAASHSLKRELTSAQALLELLNSRPTSGRLGARPKTAGDTFKYSRKN